MIVLCRASLEDDHNLVTTERRTSWVASLLGFAAADGTRVATAVAGIARARIRDAATGDVVYSVDTDSVPPALVVSIETREGTAPPVTVREALPSSARVLLTFEHLDRIRRTLEAEAAGEFQSRLSTTAHELRTPLNSIVGLCDLLDRRGRFEETAYIRQAALDLRELVDDLLDLAKLEAGKTAVRPERIVINDVFGALRAMLQPLVADRGVGLHFDCEPGLPPLVSDRARISQLLRNLIANALTFTERGDVRVSARRAGGEAIAFDVTDTGRGIAPEHQAQIFEEFSQVDSGPDAKEGGSGLGLTLARRLAERLGGSLTVRSTPGVGSTFTLTLPTRAAA